MKKINKLLVFSAHPDDDIGCAGTILFLKSLGFKVTEVVFTNGENSVNNLKPELKKSNKKLLVETRKKELAAACKILGIDELITLGLPNDNVQKTPELVEKLIKIIRAQKPTVLISENPKDYHPDHRVIGELTQECIDKAGWGILPELGDKFKTPLGLFKTGELLENARMDLVVDITAFNDKKLKAMIAYGSQLGNSSFQLTEALDTYAGFFIRKPFAESFQLINNYPIRVNALLEKLV